MALLKLYPIINGALCLGNEASLASPFGGPFFIAKSTLKAVQIVKGVCAAGKWTLP